MRFEKADPKDVFKSGYKHTKLQAVIEEFIATGIPVAKAVLENGEYSNAASAQATLTNAAKRYSNGTVKIKAINNEVYLINLVLLDKEYKIG